MKISAEDVEVRTKFLLGALAEDIPVVSISEHVGISERAVDGVRFTARFVLAANDGDVEDFLQMVEQLALETDHAIFFSASSSETSTYEHMIMKSDDRVHEAKGELDFGNDKKSALNALPDDWSSSEIRELGASLIRLADSLDQDWHPEKVKSQYHWPTVAARIEKNSLELSRRAVVLQQQMVVKDRHLPSELIGEPAWRMMLELFCQFAGGARVTTKSLVLCAGCPDTTALRYIHRLEEHGLLERSESKTDGRVTLLALTRKGVLAVGRVLEQL